MNCELLDKTRELAVKRNLDAAKVTCPFENNPICTGESCILYQAPDLAGPEQKVYGKQPTINTG